MQMNTSKTNGLTKSNIIQDCAKRDPFVWFEIEKELEGKNDSRQNQSVPFRERFDY